MPVNGRQMKRLRDDDGVQPAERVNGWTAWRVLANHLTNTLQTRSPGRVGPARSSPAGRFISPSLPLALCLPFFHSLPLCSYFSFLLKARRSVTICTATACTNISISVQFNYVFILDIFRNESISHYAEQNAIKNKILNAAIFFIFVLQWFFFHQRND